MKRSTAIRLLLADLQASRLHWKRKAERLQEQLIDAVTVNADQSSELSRYKDMCSDIRGNLSDEAYSEFDAIERKYFE